MNVEEELEMLFADFDGYDSDVDKEYQPESNDSSLSESDNENRPNFKLVVSNTESTSINNKSSTTKKSTPLEEIQINSNETTLRRKRQRNEASWQRNIRKNKHDRGEEYISSRKKLIPARRVKNIKDCENKCRLKCNKKITNEERETIFKEYYNLTTQEKKQYLLSVTERIKPTRRRKDKTDENSKKKTSFLYYFILKSSKIKVCKSYFLGTLDISQKQVYHIHAKKNSSNTPKRFAQGKHQKHFISEEDKDSVRDHINSFSRIESHYCREKTKREYLEPTLTIRKMYNLYVEKMNQRGKQPVKEACYRSIFCNEFNLSFFVPRKDRCDVCEAHKIKEKENLLNEKDIEYFNLHVEEKTKMREEKQLDKMNEKNVLCFDLQNVLSCPKADIKNFYYKSKFSVYNLTAYFTKTKQVYCAIWPESLMGRTGNDIASALYKILNSVLMDNPTVAEITLWSDSCVPQNKNSIISTAIKKILKDNSNLQNITMKFSVPGHSNVQEVDAVHSCIERTLRKTEYFSPVSLMRLLKAVNCKKPYKILQMQSSDFKDFQTLSKNFNYTEVPYTKVVSLQFNQNVYEVKYKTSFKQETFISTSIRPNLRHRQNREDILFRVLEVKKGNSIRLPKTKIDTLTSMFPWMPKVDREYYQAIFPSGTNNTN